MARSMPLSNTIPRPITARQSRARLPPAASIEPAAVADYVYEMSGQLFLMADDAGLRLLAYLLDMARLEADLVRKRLDPEGGEPPRVCR